MTGPEFTADYLAKSAQAMAALAQGPAAGLLGQMADQVIASLRGGGKLLIAGNGGSAADAQHIAGEFVSRLMYDRRPLAALALTTDSSSLTAVANDYGYEQVFARQIAALGRPGDVFLAISTSGRSASILRAIETAIESGLACLGFTGQDGGPMRERCTLLFEAPSGWTPIVQQLHITAAHILCALVERSLCPV